MELACTNVCTRRCFAHDGEEKGGASVRVEVVPRVLEGFLAGGLSGEVADGVERAMPECFERRRLHEINVEQFDVETDIRAPAGRQVVDDRHLMTAREQPAGQMRADEPRAASEEDADVRGIRRQHQATLSRRVRQNV